jgi:hypothetical protein
MKNISRLPFMSATLLGIALSFASLRAHATMMQEATAASSSTAAASAAGNWQVSWTGRDGSPKQGSMQIQQSGANLSGTFQAPRGSTKLSGSLQGNQISLDIKAGKQQFTMTGTVDGNKMSGTTGRGSAWSATRQ